MTNMELKKGGPESSFLQKGWLIEFYIHPWRARKPQLSTTQSQSTPDIKLVYFAYSNPHQETKGRPKDYFWLGLPLNLPPPGFSASGSFGTRQSREDRGREVLGGAPQPPEDGLDAGPG